MSEALAISLWASKTLAIIAVVSTLAALALLAYVVVSNVR